MPGSYSGGRSSTIRCNLDWWKLNPAGVTSENYVPEEKPPSALSRKTQAPPKDSCVGWNIFKGCYSHCDVHRNYTHIVWSVQKPIFEGLVRGHFVPTTRGSLKIIFILCKHMRNSAHLQSKFPLLPMVMILIVSMQIFCAVIDSELLLSHGSSDMSRHRHKP